MFSRISRRFISRGTLLLSVGGVLGVALLLAANEGSRQTSTDAFCESCHVHPHSTISWKMSTHYKNKSGIVVHCVECHLPPGGVYYYSEKVRTGARDIWGKLTKDISKIDWEAKSQLEHAVTHTYDESCVRCHHDLYSLDLSKKGIEAHENYIRMKDRGVRCINCHLHVGHYSDQPQEQQLPEETMILTQTGGTSQVVGTRARTLPPPPPPGPIPGEKFENYVETIPGTSINFEMIAVPGGEFEMGSRPEEPYRQANEGPAHRVRLTPFWISKTEVSWSEFEEFYSYTATRGKNEQGLKQDLDTVDAITGPTPPYGSPDQGWGKGERPAITMTHHAARVYSAWLSRVTGKRYRLPYEAEWEYACRAGTQTPYFFPGDPGDFTRLSWLNRWLGVDTDPLADYARYLENGSSKTHPPAVVKPNPFGLLHILGNVKEFCLDWYDPQAYARDSEPGEVTVDPTGPESGEEHVVRGGSYKSDAVLLRSAARDFTRTENWLATDPQSPKSIWWYSDCNDVGFRVVRRFEGEVLPTLQDGTR